MAKNKKFWNFKNTKEKNVDLKIYGEITKYSWWDDTVVTTSDFASELEAFEDIDTINLCINSPGGSVTEAHAMYNMLKRYASKNNVKIVTHIDGVAASAASYIAMVGNEINMGLGATFMIHNVNGGSWGESKDLRKTADLMDKLKENIIDIYKTQTNLSREKISELMDSATWMTPDEALEYGFIDKIETYEEISDEEIDNIFTKEITNNIKSLPPRIKAMRNKIKEAATKNTNNKINNKKGVEIVDKKTIKSEHNAVYEEIRNEAILEERNRIKDLDSVPTHNQEAIDMVNSAKYDKPETAANVAYNIMTSDSFKAHKEIAGTEQEQEESGVNKLKNLTPASKEEETAETINKKVLHWLI